jgi:hypothetical protein
MTCPACMEQAVPSLTPPRDYQSRRGAGARLAGLDTLFFGYLFLGKSVFGPVLPRFLNRPGSSGQAEAWPNRPPTRIVQDAPACAEIGCVFSELLGFKDDLPSEGSVCGHVAGNEPKLPNVPQTSTIRWLLMVIKSALWFVANGALVAEIWPFPSQVLQGWGVQKPSLLVVLLRNFDRGLHSQIGFTYRLHTGIHGLHAP